MVGTLTALRDAAESDGHFVLGYLIDVAIVEAEHIAERSELLDLSVAPRSLGSVRLPSD